MFKLIEKYEINGNISKGEHKRYSPGEICTINTANCQIYIKIIREDSVISLLKSYLDLSFDVLHAVTVNKYVDINDIRLFNLRPVALFSNFKLTTSSGKHLEDINFAHIVYLMYKLLTSNKGSDDLSLGFERGSGRRQRECTNNKNVNEKYHVRIMLKDMIGFAEHQEKATFGLEYRLTLTRNSDNAVLNKGNATNNGKIKSKIIDWYTPQ